MAHCVIFPPECIYWKKLEDHDQIKKVILPRIKELQKDKNNKNPFNLSNFTTNFNNRSKFLDDEHVESIVWKTISEMVTFMREKINFDFTAESHIITDCWFNAYNVGEYQELHNHISSPIENNGKIYHPSFSLIYILNDESEKSSIAFRNFNAHRPFVKMLDSNIIDMSHFPTVKEGVVIAFPACLEHMVRPVTTNGRITIAFNVFSDIK